MPRKPVTVPGGSSPPDSKTVSPKRVVHIALQGCCHGELDKIYDACREHERDTGQKIDFLLCCGDFQCTRDMEDVNFMAVPNKYKTLGDFPMYCDGRKRAPYLTVFIGGNHEASNVLCREYYGGFVAPNIFYIGHSGVVNILGVRVAGLSGIFKSMDYRKPYPKFPLDAGSVRSAYHVREFEIAKLNAYTDAVYRLREQGEEPPVTRCGGQGCVDIMLSHDWPCGVTKFGNEPQLLRCKPFFADDIRHNALGNPHTMSLLKAMRPRYWVSAHLHCWFEARIAHLNTENSTAESTTFIALDKCIRHRKFLDFIDVEVDVVEHSDAVVVEPVVRTDRTWLQVIRASHPHLIIGGPPFQFDGSMLSAAMVIAADAPRIPPPFPLTTADLMHILMLPMTDYQRFAGSRITVPSKDWLTGGTVTPTVQEASEGQKPSEAGASVESLGWVEDTGG